MPDSLGKIGCKVYKNISNPCNYYSISNNYTEKAVLTDYW